MLIICHILDIIMSIIFLGFLLTLIFPKLINIIIDCIYWLQNKLYDLFD